MHAGKHAAAIILLHSLVMVAASLPQIPRIIVPETSIIGVEFGVDVFLEWPLNATYLPDDVIPCTVKTGAGEEVSCAFTAADASGHLRQHVVVSAQCDHGLAAEVTVSIGDSASRKAETFAIPGILTLLPPLITVVMAISTQAVLASLFCGVWLAATIGGRYNPLVGFLRTGDTYMTVAIANAGHAQVLIFMSCLGGLILLLSKSGGAAGLADKLAQFATTKKRTEFATFGLGWVIFFDGLANSLITGTTMQPISDEMSVSREKLAFIVDATSSPIASIAPVSSWIGFELALISEGIANLQANGAVLDEWSTLDPYVIFLRTVPSRFYPILMLVFTVAIVATGRAFGPMMHAERRTATTGRVVGDWEDGTEQVSVQVQELPPNPKWYNAAVPLGFTIVMVFASLLISGYYKVLHDISEGVDTEINATTIFGSGDSYGALLWSSMFGVIIACLLYWAQGIFTLRSSANIAMEGALNMVSPLYIIILAWSLSAAVQDIGTDEYLVSLLEDKLPPSALPVIVFMIASVMSFCTGTSWGTMAIVFPLAIPLAYSLGKGEEALFTATVSSILAGAVFGDHCTPISDTTIVSSIASKCSLHHHVVTQLPYAITVALISILFCELPVGLGLPAWLGTLVGIGGVFFVVFVVARPVESTSLDLWNHVYNVLPALPSCLRRSSPSVSAEVPLAPAEGTRQYSRLSEEA